MAHYPWLEICDLVWNHKKNRHRSVALSESNCLSHFRLSLSFVRALKKFPQAPSVFFPSNGGIPLLFLSSSFCSPTEKEPLVPK